ncbi:MAG: GAF and ANTAR domain-containing protein [Dactylosporangium sp.]|nr:GAF and ANTAR domain-containing protein [Dactylosporangium sp.]NNJ60714.1 GAF and ANTAR domain-containing protein [Dactylosporangium sp.]
MVTDLHVVEIVSVLRMLTAQLVISDDLDDALARLAETAADLVHGPCSCGVTVIRPCGVSTAASSSDLPERLAAVQSDTGDGPCLSAIQQREMTVSQDLCLEDRWPGWTAWALKHHLRGVLVAPIDIDDQVIGALGLYAAHPDRFGPDVELTAMLLAEHAGLLLGGVLDRGRLATRTAELTAALGDGEIVNRAIGIVMAQRGCSAEYGLDVLCQASTTLRLPLAAVAERLVDTVSRRGMSPRTVPRARLSHGE